MIQTIYTETLTLSYIKNNFFLSFKNKNTLKFAHHFSLVFIVKFKVSLQEIWEQLILFCFCCLPLLFFLRFLFIYLRRVSEREHSWGGGKRSRGKRRSRLHWAGSQTQGSVPGPWDRDLSSRQVLNRLSHPGTPLLLVFR